MSASSKISLRISAGKTPKRGLCSWELEGGEVRADVIVVAEDVLGVCSLLIVVPKNDFVSRERCLNSEVHEAVTPSLGCCLPVVGSDRSAMSLADWTCRPIMMRTSQGCPTG